MMNMQQILGESGRTMSNEDMAMLSPRDRFKAQQMMSMSDNEPRMEDRNQVFSIEADIQNLMKSYNMLVEAQEFDRAQQVADQINMLDVQKRQAQAQNVPQEDDISRILDSISI